MTDKEIIINGVDVRKCVHRQWDNSQKIHLCYNGNSPLTPWSWCEENPNCYYKQLARKTQELKEIKEYCNNCNLKVDFTACEILQIIEGEKDE